MVFAKKKEARGFMRVIQDPEEVFSLVLSGVGLADPFVWDIKPLLTVFAVCVSVTRRPFSALCESSEGRPVKYQQLQKRSPTLGLTFPKSMHM